MRPRVLVSSLWLVTVRFPSSHRAVRRFLVRGQTKAEAEQEFASANADAVMHGVPFVGPQSRVEWTALPTGAVFEIEEARYY